MPLVAINKARRRIRKRPEWQDTRPPEEELRAAYDIAARHVDRFSDAYMASARELLTPAVIKRMRRAIQNNNTNAALKALPDLKEPVWMGLKEKLGRAYVDVVTEAGENEFTREKIPLTFRITKAEVVPIEPGVSAVSVGPTVPVVAVNPWSLKWIEAESSKLIRGVSKDTQEAVRQIIKRGFDRGLRTDAILDQIKSRVGLLAREELAVQRRLDLMISREIPIARATAAAERYAAQLHTKRAQRIGRTEMITAQSKGRRDAWGIARQRDELPVEVERVWAAVSASPRTCEICEDLDGQSAAIGEDYQSAVLGRAVEGPGMDAHPH